MRWFSVIMFSVFLLNCGEVDVFAFSLKEVENQEENFDERVNVSNEKEFEKVVRQLEKKIRVKKNWAERLTRDANRLEFIDFSLSRERRREARRYKDEVYGLERKLEKLKKKYQKTFEKKEK